MASSFTQSQPLMKQLRDMQDQIGDKLIFDLSLEWA